MAKSKKIMKYKEEDFTEVQEYMKGKSVEQSRMAFRVRSELVNKGQL